jgi:uncharacterized protein (TIGR02246 family)
MGTRRLACAVLVAVMAACTNTPPPPASEDADRRAISELVANENAGFTSSNVNELLKLYTDDVVMMPPGEPPIQGKAKLRPWLEKLFSQVRMGSTTVSEDLRINGAWAVERLVLHSTTTPVAGGTAVVESGKVLHVYQRQADGSWRIAQDIWNTDGPLNTSPAPAAPAAPATPGPVAPASPGAAPSSAPPPGVASDPAVSGPKGKIENAQAVADLIAYHQDAVAGSAYRTRGVITRWDLPVRIFVDPSVKADNVQRVMAVWQLRAGISYSFLQKDSEPRILVRAGTDGLLGTALARGGVDATEPNNRAKSALVVIKPEVAFCDIGEANCFSMFGRVMGGALGLFGQVPGGISASAIQPSPREIDMLRTLYQLPHGAQIKADGTWAVVR